MRSEEAGSEETTQEAGKTLLSRREFHVASLAIVGSTATGCGTLMYPDRIGQPRTGPVDWTVVGLDAIGLCFFFIPGLIAFAVDFGNGTMFYPAPDGVPSTAEGPAPSNATPPKQALKSVPLPPGKLTLSELAQIASRETGKSIELVEGAYETEPLSSIDDFWIVERRFATRQAS